ncbi:hypothetical protein EW145_g4325 [Phellinidium pouzarii]|uniref:Sm domain-containing protein n=1 Tax=Phellinidium pouzarii TaxID=167371 RepID=A0A4S4L464_9AGAM|nr:hypothetical protein EW145_g4325 [Phellinidium pouzarii]
MRREDARRAPGRAKTNGRAALVRLSHPANLVLEDTIERMYHGATYADLYVGIFLIRGENVVLLGEIDLDLEDEVPLKPASYQALKPLYAQDMAEKKHRDYDKAQVLYEEQGFCREGGEGDGY